MSTYTQPLRSSVLARRDAGWFVLGSGVAFLVPYLGVSVLDLQHDVYYLVYFTVTLGLLGAYAHTERIDLGEIFRRQWLWSIAIGILVAAFVVLNVFRTGDATPRPHGAYFAFEVLWRGVTYGAVDALLCTAFPCIVAYRLLHGHIAGVTGRLRYTALALPLVIVVTATYHWGYPQYRQDGLARPETGNTIISIPTFATANPVGSIVAHISMHTAAVVHSYETDIFLPPETKATD